jgi:thioester reductase-like protein
MPQRQAVLLTGATGMLGQYLLRDLLLADRAVAVLGRPSPQGSAEERLAEIVALWSQSLGRTLPTPVVLAGDLATDALALTAADRRWLGQHCRAVIHSAANLSFRETTSGEPWRTNVAGTESLLALCRDAGVREWHQVSTAFVCGRRAGFIAEEDDDPIPSFHNAYEESKFQAERLIRRTPGIRATIYRPSVIVGDSRTGHTSSFNGLYRFLELAIRLASRSLADGEPGFRLPLNGDEMWNLVPADWVSRAIVGLLARSPWHGRTFHLVSPAPVSTRFIRDVGAEILDLPGVGFRRPAREGSVGRLEQLFADGIREYWPYLGGNPTFSCENTRAALPDLPPPIIDRAMLERLIRFAVANRWGRGRRQASELDARDPNAHPPAGCAEYIEQVFPRQARQSNLAREAGLDLVIGLDIQGPGGGQWSSKWVRGELIYAGRGLEEDAAVIYRTDAATFHAVVNGTETPQEAFFKERVAIKGDLETALKLAVLFGLFLAENPVRELRRKEVMDSTLSQS